MRTWQIIQLSLYWFGINAIWGGLNNVILPARVEGLVGRAYAGQGLAIITAAAAIVAILVQPTVGAISDYTISRWGRRKPYIAIGATLDVLFLIGVALSQTYVMLVACVILLQFSSNFAQGPFQGYVPDLVPARQVGLASGLVGLMTIAGRVGGVIVATNGIATHDFVLSTIGLGILELATAIGTLLWVDEGRVAPSRAGRSWLAIGLSAWGLDILKQRSFVWLIASRLFVLMAAVTLTDLIFFYMSRAQALSREEIGTWIRIATVAVVVTIGLTTYPASRLSDRFGRKRLIYASCVLGAFGMLGMVMAPTPPVAVAFGVVVAVGIGAFTAVDWALLTDIIPKATTGRYMGISNVVTAGAGPLAIAAGGLIMDRVGQVDFALGPRAAYAVAIVFFLIGALLLRPVDERRRES